MDRPALAAQLAGVLAERGARVAIVARGQAALEDAAQQLRALGGDVLPLSADATDGEDVARIAATLQERWGGVDFLAHCAGRSMRGNVLSTSAKEFQELWGANFLSAIHLSHSFTDALAANRGHLVLIGSLASKVGSALSRRVPGEQIRGGRTCAATAAGMRGARPACAPGLPGANRSGRQRRGPLQRAKCSRSAQGLPTGGRGEGPPN